jgi:hypothetical protein
VTPIDSGGGLCDLWRREGPMRKVKPEEAAGLLREWEASGEPMSSWCTRRGLNWYSLSAFKGWGVRAPEVPFAVVVVAPAAGDAAPVRDHPRYRVEVGAVTIEVGDDFRADTLQRLLVAVAAC